jgi:hypothetical protein
MKASRIIAFATALLGASACAEAEVRFRLPAPPAELVASEDLFLPFANEVRAEVERLLSSPDALDDPDTFKLLLSTRVHLAHHFADNRTATATAAWIRSLQTDPANRAFAGLTTFASVEARRELPGTPPGDAAYREAFRKAFARQLSILPRNAATVTMLRGQREKIDGITPEALMREVRDVIAPAIERRGWCGLAEADQLVRVRHRLESIVPVRAETLAALDAAIAERISK